MRIDKKLFFGVIALTTIGCNDVGAGMKYQNAEIGVINGRAINCFRFGWGLDAQAIYIGANRDVCGGFDSSTNICFGRGQYAIYYKIEADTLKLYTDAHISIPSRFPVPVQLKNSIGQLAWAGKLKEVDFNGPANEVSCWLSYKSNTGEMTVKEK